MTEIAHRPARLRFNINELLGSKITLSFEDFVIPKLERQLRSAGPFHEDERNQQHTLAIRDQSSLGIGRGRVLEADISFGGGSNARKMSLAIGADEHPFVRMRREEFAH